MDARRLILVPLAVVMLCVWQTGPAGAEPLAERANCGLVEIITGSPDGTTAKIAEDLANVLDDTGTRRVLAVVGKGSLQNVVDLRLLRGVDIALVQSDVLDYARTHSLYPASSNSLTYIAKLYNAELHLLAREDIRSINDLAGKKVNFGAPGDGTTITGPAIFSSLKISVEATSYDPSMALEKLRSGEIAALAIVAGKPTPLFRALRAEDGLHFVAIPLNADIVGGYLPARLTHDDYPDLVTGPEPVNTVATGMAMMVAPLVPNSERYSNVVKFVDVLFTQFPDLLEPPHHPKWREVNLMAELPGWRRFPPVDAWIKQNAATPAAANRQQMREIFSRFLDERGRAAGGATLTAQQKEDLFNQFERWQSGQGTRANAEGSSGKSGR